MVIRQNLPLTKASDLKTYEVNQLETGDNKLSFHLEKIAKGLKLYVEQLVD